MGHRFAQIRTAEGGCISPFFLYLCSSVPHLWQMILQLLFVCGRIRVFHPGFRV
jgi:hypothetical protein